MLKVYDDVERAFLYTDIVHFRESISVAQTERDFRECIVQCTHIIKSLNDFDGESVVYPGKPLLLREFKQHLQEIQETLEKMLKILQLEKTIKLMKRYGVWIELNQIL